MRVLRQLEHQVFEQIPYIFAPNVKRQFQTLLENQPPHQHIRYKALSNEYFPSPDVLKFFCVKF